MNTTTIPPIVAQLIIIGSQVIYPYIGLDTYTKINLLWFVIGIFTKCLAPFVFVNSCAITTSFYIAMILEPEPFNRLIGSNPIKAHVILGLAHIVPLVIMGYQLHGEIPKHIGFWTMLHHISWGFTNSYTLCLDRVYEVMPLGSWHKMWLIACGTHMIVPWIM
jgi:hypothetical protein